MPCIRIPGGILTVAGPTLKIRVGNRVLHFEDHSYCGPIQLSTVTGDPVKREGMPFLTAVSLWHQQGKKIGDDGICIWKPKALDGDAGTWSCECVNRDVRGKLQAIRINSASRRRCPDCGARKPKSGFVNERKPVS